jgi:predicted dehydrogenase
MAETIKVGIIGAGWPGAAHARGFQSAGGYKLIGVADLIPERRAKFMAEFGGGGASGAGDARASSATGAARPIGAGKPSGAIREFASADDLLADKEIAAVSVCVPNDLHAKIVVAALRAGKHVICESPPAISATEAKRMQTAAKRYARVLLFAMQRRFGGHEQAARQAIVKGYAGEVFHARASWTRTRAIPAGTGWYTDKSKSGGGVMMDLGLHMLDLAWSLLGEPKLLSASAVAHHRFGAAAAGDRIFDVEDSAMALLKFDGGKTLELSAAWAINQPPAQNGAICRVYGDKGAIEVYTPQGAMLYRDFQPNGDAKATALKPPKMIHHTAMMRHFRQCIIAGETPEIGGEQAIQLMGMMGAIYKSVGKGKIGAKAN